MVRVGFLAFATPPLGGGSSQMASKSKSTEKKTIYRDSETGRITTEDYAKRHPKTTEKERVRVPKK